MGWDASVLVALIKTNSAINKERMDNASGADERMKARTAQALKFILKKEKNDNESKGGLNEQTNRLDG